MAVDPNENYDAVRCRVCGRPWRQYEDDFGRVFAGHPLGRTCSRYSPVPRDLAQVVATVYETEAASPLYNVPSPQPVTSGYLHAEIVHANGSQS